MINSMTGYGQAKGQLDDVTYAVEIRTVNNRYFKTKLKLPESVPFLVDDIEKLLRRNLTRGMINCTLWLKNISSNMLFDVDELALKAYIEKLSKIISSADAESTIDVVGLLTLPGIIQPALPNKKEAEQMKKVALSVTQEAIEKVKQMRAAEGSALAADLECYCKQLKQGVEQIRSRAFVVLDEYKEKLRKRINELLASAELKLDEETLAREVAVFAERSDISEELTRLESHLNQFAESCATDGEPAGRRLDFLSQEMLREANTIASKASDSEITRRVVDMKCRIDRIKEQVQNIE